MLEERLILRNRIVGLLLRRKREQANVTKRECADALGVSTSTITSYEDGRKPISLPELEVLAYLLDTPIQSLWDSEPESIKEREPLETPALLVLRQRIIGALLRQARTEENCTQQDLADVLGCSTSTIASYEYGEKPVPLPELEVLAEHLHRPTTHFLDREGPVGQWQKQIEAWQRFQELPEEVQEFILRPSNIRYLEVAMHLAEIPAGGLRGIAEGLLEITY